MDPVVDGEPGRARATAPQSAVTVGWPLALRSVAALRMAARAEARSARYVAVTAGLSAWPGRTRTTHEVVETEAMRARSSRSSALVQPPSFGPASLVPRAITRIAGRAAAARFSWAACTSGNPMPGLKSRTTSAPLGDPTRNASGRAQFAWNARESPTMSIVPAFGVGTQLVSPVDASRARRPVTRAGTVHRCGITPCSRLGPSGAQTSRANCGKQP